jgi:Haemolymph juvenile hormone binding protein (JHBP)
MAIKLQKYLHITTTFSAGIPQLQVPGYEPLVIPALHIDRSTDALEVTASLENLKVAGGSKFILNTIE